MSGGARGEVGGGEVETLKSKRNKKKEKKKEGKINGSLSRRQTRRFAAERVQKQKFPKKTRLAPPINSVA